MKAERIQQATIEIIRVLILAGADTQARDSEGRMPVELLRAEDDQGRAIFEEVLIEKEYGDLKPGLK
jgi:hypothetical protein